MNMDKYKQNNVTICHTYIVGSKNIKQYTIYKGRN